MTGESRRQRQRAVTLRHQLRAAADRRYDPDAALLRRFHPTYMRFTGHTVAQESLEYALLLLHSRDRAYGTDDRTEANRILRKILSYQDRRTGSETYGNFFWMTHWDRVKDANAVSFLAPGLAYTWLTFADELEADTRTALGDALPMVLRGLRAHRVRWQYTNIFFLNLGGLVGVAAALGDESAHAEASREFDAWLAGTSDDGLHEFNSPSYTAVSLFGLEAAWAHTPDPGLRERLERILSLLAYHVAVNIAPSGVLGGAYARSYHDGAVRGAGGTSAWAHVKLGTPVVGPASEQSISSAAFTLFDWIPPEPVRAIATEKPSRVDVVDQTRSLGSRRTHVMTPGWSLASQTVTQLGGKAAPPYVLLVRPVASARPTVPLLPDESFHLAPRPICQAVQEGGRVLVRLRYDNTPADRDDCLADHTVACEPRILFGPHDDIEHLWTDGGTVVVSYGDVWLGVLAVAVDRQGTPVESPDLASTSGPRRVTLVWDDDGELRLRMRMFGAADLAGTAEPVDVVVLLEVTDSGPAGRLTAYQESFARWRLVAGADAVTALHPGEGLLRCPAADRPQQLLHRSPYLCLVPGDLERHLGDGANGSFVTFQRPSAERY